MSRIDQPRMIRALRSYFASGWAFLIPYLAVYLLYYATDWPVNPASDSESGKIPDSAMPCLLHVYWVLHAANLALGAIALWASPNAKSEESKVNAESFMPPPPTHIRRFLSLFTFHSFIFWGILALIFYIPGVYLEWPSDPWEHLRRINEWHTTATVGAHSCWYKSAYFIPYSLLSWATGLRQLFWLDFYYTGICLLLCWQYYRLSRACGLGERASMIFVLIQAILFGNNIFSFYRYYGISSSIYAQIGAVAITRIALEFATRGASHEQQSGSPLSEAIPVRPFWHWPTLFTETLPAIGCLVPFVAFNHQQGIGIAALGVLAIVIWRTIEWKRTSVWWLIAGTLIFNALFLWLYPKPPVIDIYRANGALNAWYGFNIFDFTHPIGDRMLQIVSAFGLVNILAALLLLPRNHVSAWLTITPLIALSLPCISIPVAEALSNNGQNPHYIITFQRMLFSIPTTLASICITNALLQRGAQEQLKTKIRQHIELIICTALTTIVTSPSAGPTYNRFWNLNSIVPDDLEMRDLSAQSTPGLESINSNKKVVSNKAGAALLAFYPIKLIGASQDRGIGMSPATAISAVLNFLEFDGTTNAPYPRPIKAVAESHPTDLNLISDPCASTPTAWLTLGGHPPKFRTGFPHSHTAQTALQNPPGLDCHIFTSALIPVQLTKSYRLEMSVKQTSDTASTVYLAIAWYDEHEKLLASDMPGPDGAGNPQGWVNGTYSYFGLTGQLPPTTWTTYQIAFGINESAKIPRHACFVRVGALLNYHAAPQAEVLLTNIELYESPPPCIITLFSNNSNTYSPTSIAAQLSRHWPPQQVMTDRSGSQEMKRAVNSTGTAISQP